MIRAAFGFVALVAISGAAHAEPATTQFENWLAAFNTGDKATIQKFYGEHLGDADALTARNMRAETCGFDLARVEDKNEKSFRALLVQRCFPALFRVSFSVAADGKTLENLKLQPFAMPEARALAATRDIAQRLAASDAFAGSIIVAQDGRAPWTYSVGTFSRDDARPITADTPMFLASAGKMFTAVSIFQLIEKGKVALDAQLSRYVPDYPNKDMAKVTIRQLLGHRGGTGEDGVLQRDDTANREWVRTINDYIKLNGNRPPAFAPGSKFAYSNYGFILLGAVIERVSGQTYQDYVQRHVFGPAGMTHASFPDLQHITDVPVGYSTFFEAEPTPIASTAVLPQRGSAAGGGVASATDMLRFFTALRSNVLLSAKSRMMATEPSKKGWYGLGFVTTAGKHPQWGHGGFGYGMSVAAQRFPDEKTTFICIATRDGACDRMIYVWSDRRFGLTE
ncbi:serine hydrolase domain-containing protein [Sphingomonas lacusdianchii]|uniref:serine hydrolase domain-containing protein n=1 Tax=Sphingomonas lacusdianchii TaxID=2917992 RepID=UPI001F564BFD|nr:serine hydrolase domain-containing protein [Sphingomonas sp. JXJ CY 53]